MLETGLAIGSYKIFRFYMLLVVMGVRVKVL